MSKSATKNKIQLQSTAAKAPIIMNEPLEVIIDADADASDAEAEVSDAEDDAEASDAEDDEVEDDEVEEDDVDAEDDDVDVEADASDAEDEDVEGSDAEADRSDAEAAEGSDAEDDDTEEGKAKSKAKLSKKTNKTKNKKTKVNTISGIEMLKTTKKPAPITIDDDEDENESDVPDDDNDMNDNYLQKFDSELRENYIMENHAESKAHNYEEVKAMTRVVRDGRGIIVDPLHKTTPILTKYEMTRILGQRAKQLDSGAKTFVKVPLNVIDGYFIAMIELEQKKIPFIIKRPIPNGGVEYWNVSDLEILI